MNQRADFEHLRVASVYPGHPITVAYLITQTYPDFDSAFFRGEKDGYEAALADWTIPGAGGNVSAALELLHYLRHGTFKKAAREQKISVWGFACKWADDYWRRCDDQAKADSPRWKEGQDQADGIKPLLKSQQAWWRKPSASR